MKLFRTPYTNPAFIGTPAPVVGRLCILAFCLATLTAASQGTCIVTVNPAQIVNPKASKLLGLTFDGRSSADSDASAAVVPVGYYNPVSGTMLTAVKPLWDRVPMGGVRYPGNLVIYNWNWFYTIGPFASRTTQPMGQGGAFSQKLQFGFDEFMAMTLSKGIPSNEVQIMVNIYASVGQPNPAILAADWVEYCNAADDSSNLRGGTDWAHLRAIYGHPEPYNIRIWNIGNEPWSPMEFGISTAAADNYMAVASPIIDSMLAVDPGLHITIPAIGNAGSPWNAEIMNPLAPIPLLGRIYGISPHAFYDNDASTTNVAPSQVLTSFSTLAGVAAGKNLKIIAGDHAAFAPSADPDKAMRWEGALATGEYLLGISQIGNIELANFWIYGNTQAVWHPIRSNANGTYTLMAAAQLYESLFPYFYDQVLSSSIVNSIGGVAVPNTRVSAFQNTDQTKTSIIIINTSLANDNQIIPPALSGFLLQTSKLLSASSLSQDTFMTTSVAPLPNGNYQSPHASILILDYAATVLSVEYADPLRAYPVKAGIQVEWATAREANCDRFEVESSSDGTLFSKIKTVKGNGSTNAYHLYKITDTAPFNGLNYYWIKQIDFDGAFRYSKIIAASYEAFEISIYPNPSGDFLHFRTSEPIEQVEVVNTLGSLVKTILKPGSAIDIRDLPNGIYRLNFLDRNHRVLSKTCLKN
ncbi:MAG: T9SS type A sorting domain-containing protein [Saprospiraceae bacterium]|nr:T9SS type A sorting domain-containing protein [Saprospiraceae bacterium]MDZ4703727.1 T9SS type A sorting domain-containing protein [Saprospiraceae bacterium]